MITGVGGAGPNPNSNPKFSHGGTGAATGSDLALEREAWSARSLLGSYHGWKASYPLSIPKFGFGRG